MGYRTLFCHIMPNLYEAFAATFFKFVWEISDTMH